MSTSYKEQFLQLFSSVTTEELQNLKSNFEENLSKSELSGAEESRAKSDFNKFYSWLLKQELSFTAIQVLEEESGVFRNANQLIEAYSKQAKRQNAEGALLHAIAKYIAPDWGFPYINEERGRRRSGQYSRNNPKERAKLINFLENLEIPQLRKMVHIFHKNTQDKNPRDISSYKSSVLDFYAWCATKKVFLPLESPYESKEMRIVDLRRQMGGEFKNKKPKTPRVKPYALMCSHCGVRQKKGIPRKIEQLYPQDYINPALGEDLDSFFKFRKNMGLRKATIDADENVLMRMLGWLHRVKKVPLEKLRLGLIIDYTPLYLDCSKEESKESVIEKKMLHEEAIEASLSTSMEIVDEYFEFKRDEHLVSNNSLQIEIKTLIAIAKWLYRNDLNRSIKYLQYSDVPVIKALQSKSRNLPEDPQRVPYSEKMISWEELLETAEYLRQVSSCTHYRQPGGKLVKMPDERRWKYFQKFLVLMLNIVLPPQRSRSYYELKVGETFVFGEFKNKKVVPSKDGSGQWYMRLAKKHNDKKETHYWSLSLDNIKFRDGTRLYDYIDEWLSQGRGECDHNYVFRTHERHIPFDHRSWGNYINRLFKETNGVNVGQNSLRHMFVTHLANLRLGEEYQKSANIYQNHDDEIADEVYNEQDLRDKMKLFAEVAPEFYKGLGTRD